MRGEREPCGLVIQTASLTQAEGCRTRGGPRGATCEQGRSGRGICGCCRHVAGQRLCPAVQTGLGFVTFLVM